MNLRVTSRTASRRVASSPPMVKSFVNIEPDTSSTSMMSIPLASTWDRLFPSCGRAIAMMKAASESQTRARRNRPARLALPFPIARKGEVPEKITAALGPILPRNKARAGINSNKSSSHGRAKLSVWPFSHSGGDKHASFHKTARFIQEQTALFRRRLIAGKFDEVAAVQEIGQQCFFFFAEFRSRRDCIDEFDRGLAGHRQVELFENIAP